MPYVTATIKVNEPLGDGLARLAVDFTGDAGEPVRTRYYNVTGSSTGPLLRQWAFAQLADLNLGRTVGTLPALQAGQGIVPLAPPADPAPTAEQLWQAQAKQLVRATALGLTNAAAVTDLATLRTTVNTNYVAGYLGRF